VIESKRRRGRFYRGFSVSNVGIVTQIIGPVVDVCFNEGQTPAILNALEVDVKAEDGIDEQVDHKVTLEVLQHIGDNRVRCVAMSATEGMSRGLEARDTGSPIRVPVGNDVLGRMFNVTGDPVDGLGAFSCQKYESIHR
jgi:F-type H+-transporting ATPase subunit beta